MKAPEVPPHESARLLRLRRLRMLDTPPEAVLDAFTRLAAGITGMPTALISLLDADRQWFKSAFGMPQGSQTPREFSFCGHAILQPALFEVEDARSDPRFHDNPLVTGEPHVTHYAGMPLRMPDGEAVGTLCVLSPRPGRLTEQQRGQLAALATALVEVLLLREKELEQNLLLARALEASSLGLWELDLEAGQVYLSAGWTQLLGLRGKDWQVRPSATLSFLPQQELPRILEGRRRLLKGEIERLSLEHQMIKADGTLVWVLSEAKVIERDAAGRARQVVGTSKDITERMRADAELRAALQAADQASVAKSEFLATMSHEIRTPLNGVIGLTQLLREARLPPMESDSVAMIDSCAKSLLSLVDNILDFSKIEAGHLTLETVPTDLAQMVQELSDLFAVRATEKGIRFDLHQPAGLPRWILADPGRLRQVLLNLLGNALKFTEVGSFGLRVSVEGPEAARQLCFAVVDTGPGIPAAAQARLFTRFTQVAGQVKREPGTGLGLAISRQLAHLMGGDVTLVSQEGLGSRFTLQIPLRLASAPVTATNMNACVARTDARLLLAEDNEVNQLVAQRMLAALGFKDVKVVADGRQAVDAFASASYDLVLMDCQMPVLDGWQATRELRERGVTVPVLAFTAAATLGDRERCLAAGMDDYLTKPIEKAVLAEKLHRWLSDAEGPAAAAEREPEAKPEVFDAGSIERFFLGDAGLYSQALEVFTRQTRASLAELATASGDLEQLARIMHRMRSSAATLGGTRLARLCGELEQLPAAERLDQVSEELERFVARAAQAV